MEPRKEGVAAKEALQLRPAKAVKIEGRKLLSVGETPPVKIPRLQAEILAERLERGREVWHVTPRRETTLVLAVFDHEPTSGEVTKERVEEFLEESLQNRALVELQGSLVDFENLLANFENIEFKISDDRREQTIDMAGLAKYMRNRWFQSQKREKAPETKEELAEGRWEGDWMTVPEGTPIRSAPLSSEGPHAEVQETTTKMTRLPVMGKIKDGNIIHYNIRGKGGVTKGWVTMIWQGEKGKVL